MYLALRKCKNDCKILKIILAPDFCPLKPEIARFSIGFCLKPSNLTHTMLLLSSRTNIAKNMFMFVLYGLQRLAWYRGKMYIRNLFYLRGISFVCVARIHL